MRLTVIAAVGIFFVLLVIVALIIIAVRLARPRRKAQEPEPPPEDPLAAVRAIYDTRYIALEVPRSASQVQMASGNAALRFYCWVDGGSLLLFPTWESLLAAGAIAEYQQIDWRIPLENIICHATQQGLPNRFTVLQYKSGEEALSLAFSDEAARVFSALLPEKDLSHLLEEIYPKSSKNIQDIKESFVSLKELRGEDLITEDEFAAKKKDMLLTL